MRWTQTLLITLFLSGIALSQTPAQSGIYKSDVDQKADPCTDFFEYANGACSARNDQLLGFAKSKRMASLTGRLHYLPLPSV